MKRPCLAVLIGIVVLVQSTVGADLDATRLVAVRSRMQQFVDQGEIAGAVTLIAGRDGVVSLEAVGYQDREAKKPMRTDSLFRIASMTKPVTAVGIMILADEGKLSVTDPVEKYLPEFAGQALAVRGKEGMTLQKPSRPITLRDLLTHTSGMSGGLPRSPAQLYEKRDTTLAEAVRLFAKEPLQFEPGTKWQYCNIGIDTLGRVIEVVSGESYEAFLQKRIFNPLGMVDTCFYPSPSQAERIAVIYGKKDGQLVATTSPIVGPTADAKYPIPAAGLYSTASDMARFYRMMLCQGQLDGQRILSPASVALMTQVHTGELAAGFTEGLGFGLGWGVIRMPTGVTAMLSPGTFGHGGAFGTQGWIDPQKDLVLVMMIQRVGLPNGDASAMRREFQQAAVSALESGAN